MCFQHEIVTKSNHYLLGQKEMELSQVRGSAQPRWLPSEVKSFQISFKARASVCFAQANDLKWRSTISEFQAFSSQSCCIFISVSRGQISYWYDYYFSILLLLQNPWHVHLQGIKLAKNEKNKRAEDNIVSFNHKPWVGSGSIPIPQVHYTGYRSHHSTFWDRPSFIRTLSGPPIGKEEQCVDQWEKCYAGIILERPLPQIQLSEYSDSYILKGKKKGLLKVHWS